MNKMIYDDKNEKYYDFINKEEEDIINPSLSKNELFTYPADFTLEVLKNKLDKNEIVIPDWQRRYVWTLNQASQLVDSFLLGLPVPAIYLYLKANKEDLLVVDGQQRLISISQYFDGVFNSNGKKQEFKVKIDSKTEWSGKTFNDLSDECQKKFKNCILRAFIIKQFREDDNYSIYQVFKRLNTGGTSLSDQEIRNSIYFSPFSEMLKELNKNKAWRNILGSKKEDRRARDIEQILRFFCLRDNWEHYKKPMHEFLSNYMEQKMNDSKLENYKEIFEKTINKVVSTIGSRPFSIKKGINGAFMDSVLIAFSTNNTIPDDIKERYIKIKKDEKFLSFIMEHTTDVDKVKNRIQRANQVLFE